MGAAMLSSWSWARPRCRLPSAANKRSRWFIVVDELWRALRGAPDWSTMPMRPHPAQPAVRGRSLMATHSLRDLQALPGALTMAKAMGFIDHQRDRGAGLARDVS